MIDNPFLLYGYEGPEYLITRGSSRGNSQAANVRTVCQAISSSFCEQCATSFSIPYRRRVPLLHWGRLHRLRPFYGHLAQRFRINDIHSSLFQSGTTKVVSDFFQSFFNMSKSAGNDSRLQNYISCPVVSICRQQCRQPLGQPLGQCDNRQSLQSSKATNALKA